MKVSVLGLGKLGACLVASLAESGHQVRGFDVSAAAVESINTHQPMVYEPGLAELLEKNAGRFEAFNDVGAALTEADVVHIIVPTPSKPEGDFANDYVTQAL